MTYQYQVLSPRTYIKDGVEKTAFTKIGVAFTMKEKDGLTLTLEALPLQSLGQTGKLECRLLLLPPLDKDDAVGHTSETYAKKAAKDKAALDSDSVPF